MSSRFGPCSWCTWKIMKFAENWRLRLILEAQNSKLALLTQNWRCTRGTGTPDMIRQADSSFACKSNTIVHRAKLEGRQPWTMWAEFLEKLKMLRVDQFVLDRNNFPSNNICVARFMQNLSSIHRRRKHFGHVQGLPWCNRGTWESWNLLKNSVFQGARAPKSANSLRWRESPPRSDS